MTDFVRTGFYYGLLQSGKFLAMVNTNVGGSFEKYGCMKKKFPNCERRMLII